MWRAWTLVVWLMLSLVGVGSAMPAAAAEAPLWSDTLAQPQAPGADDPEAAAPGLAEAATAESAWAPPLAGLLGARRPREGWAPKPRDAGPASPTLDGPLRPPKHRA